MVTFRIHRFDPYLEESAYLQDFEIDVTTAMTVLDCLIEIKDQLDGSLTFRRSCRSGICGSCAVRVNHRAMLACKTQALNVVKDGSILIEPLNHLRNIKDLVVDMDSFFKTIEQIQPWLITRTFRR